MMKIKKIAPIVLSFILLSSLMLSCSKSKNIKPSGKLQLHFKIINNTMVLNAPENTSTTKSNLEWDEGFMNVQSVSLDSVLGEIEGKKNNEIGQGLQEKDTSFIINFFNQTQKFLNVNITPGNYHHIKIRVDIAQTSFAPALFLKGKFTDTKGNLIPIECSLNEGNISTNVNTQQNGEFQGGQDKGLALVALADKLNVDTQNIATVEVGIDFKLLFEGINSSDLEAATKSNGVIVINKTKNVTLYNLIKSRVNRF